MYVSFFDELIKIAEDQKPVKERALESFVKVRPYAASGFGAGVPAAVFGKIVGGEGPTGSRLARTLGIVGAGLGMGNEALKQWAKKNKRRRISKAILSKNAAMAGDLRTLGLGGVKRPPFPTEGSKSLAFKQFRASTKPGKFTNVTQPKHLVRPGPSISQTATLPKV